MAKTKKKNHFTKKTRRVVLFIHVLFSAIWLGAGLSMILIMFLKHPDSLQEHLGYNWAIKLIDDYLIIISALGSLLTGLLLSWKTPLGFFKHWWIAIKLVLTVFVIFFGISYLGPTTNKLVALLETHGQDVFAKTQYKAIQDMLKVIAITQFLFIVIILYISIIKPFKKINPPKATQTAK